LHTWRKLISTAGFAIAVLSLAGSPWGALSTRTAILAASRAESRFILVAWACASAGLAMGLSRTVWTLWKSDSDDRAGSNNDLRLLLVGGLLVLVLYIGLRPDAITQRISLWY
jgi:hypothetical protein